MKNGINCWLTVKGADTSERNKRSMLEFIENRIANPEAKLNLLFQKHMKGKIVDMQPHYEKEKRYWFKVEWYNGEFGTYYNDDGKVTQHRPKKLKETTS